MSSEPPPLTLMHDSCDEHGVARHVVDGRSHDQPVLLARVVTSMIAGYTVTDDHRYLDRAQRNLDRLLEIGVRRRGALYFPYRYEHRLASSTMEPVWYSSMAQGLALSALCRMYYVTGDRALASTADDVFESFVKPPRRRRPWTAHTDECDHLWLEEYPDPQGCEPMRVLNGHNFAAIGVYDHLWLTGSEEAAIVLDAALTTIVDHGDDFRVPGGCSNYSLTRPVQKPGYHGTHVWQIRRFGAWTGDDRFGAIADRFAADSD